jgi:hypothetical protein
MRNATDRPNAGALRRQEASERQENANKGEESDMMRVASLTKVSFTLNLSGPAGRASKFFLAIFDIL